MPCVTGVAVSALPPSVVEVARGTPLWSKSKVDDRQPSSVSTRNALYAQSGGVTAVINASACGVIETARSHDDVFGKVLAGRNGIVGVLTEDLIDTSLESDDTIAALRHTPAGAFGSARYKLKGFEDSSGEYERLIEVFAAHDIGYFFYNGGGDSADTCLKVSEISHRMGYPIQAIHIPKTVDNDLPVTDNSPGFGSAAKFVAVSTLETGFDVRSMAETSTKVFILEVMGRHAGWLAAAAGLASKEEGDAPHVILFPEIVFDEAEFLARVENSVAAYGFCSVVVSEGVRGPAGRFLSAAGTSDAFGHIQLGGVAPVVGRIVEEHLGYKHHWAVADYLQRSARHIASKTDVDQAYAVGKAGVEMAVRGANAVMPTIVRESSDPYRWTIGSTPLSNVANVEKKMPEEFISDDGFSITPQCRIYLAPLIEGEDYPPYSNGLPRYVRLANVAVEPKLTAFHL